MHLKLIVLPLVLLICFSFANANAKTAAVSNKKVQTLDVADRDDNLIPADDEKHDEDDSNDIDDDEYDEDEPENDPSDESYDAVDFSDEKPSGGFADPKPYWGRRRG